MKSKKFASGPVELGDWVQVTIKGKRRNGKVYGFSSAGIHGITVYVDYLTDMDQRYSEKVCVLLSMCKKLNPEVVRW